MLIIHPEQGLLFTRFAVYRETFRESGVVYDRQ